jgi:hypothetical protein
MKPWAGLQLALQVLAQALIHSLAEASNFLFIPMSQHPRKIVQSAGTLHSRQRDGTSLDWHSGLSLAIADFSGRKLRNPKIINTIIFIFVHGSNLSRIDQPLIGSTTPWTM